MKSLNGTERSKGLHPKGERGNGIMNAKITKEKDPLLKEGYKNSRNSGAEKRAGANGIEESGEYLSTLSREVTAASLGGSLGREQSGEE